jgi:hypothetical protein
MLTSFWLCYVTASARISWNLPPEELFFAAYIPSLRAVQKIALLVLLAIVLGPLSLADFIAAGPIRYPVRGLF